MKTKLELFKKYGLLAIVVPLLSGCGGGDLALASLFSAFGGGLIPGGPGGGGGSSLIDS